MLEPPTNLQTRDIISSTACEQLKPDHRNAPRVGRSLAFQLATRLSDYRKLLLTYLEITEPDRGRPTERLQYLVSEVTQ